MKTKKTLQIALLVVGFFLLLTNKVKSQTVNVASIIPDTVGIWGPPMTVDMLGTECIFRIKVIKHFGTTCVYNVEITNKGSKKLSAGMGFLTNGGLFNPNTGGDITIKPGESFYWKREKREVLKKRVKNQAQVCKNCNPILGFYNLKVGGVSVN